MAAVWWITLVILWGLSLLVIRQWKGAGVLASVAAVYIFLQVSSQFFLIPWYKDGGNGAGLSDWWVWMVQSLILTGFAYVLAMLTRVSSKAR